MGGILTVLLFPLVILKFILLRLTFRKCGNCAHHYRNPECYWTGSCYRTNGYPVICGSKPDSDNKHVCDWACIHYRLFLWKKVWYRAYMHLYRFFTGRNIYLSTADGTFVVH